jgi:hypothetical protein
MAGHDGPESAVTFDRNGRSRSAGIPNDESHDVASTMDESDAASAKIIPVA